MGLPTIHVFTHDSIGVGEDGPTHQPIEQLPSLRAIPSGCAFRTRCPLAIEDCSTEVPPLLTVGPGRDAACIRRTTIPAKEAV